MLRCHYQLMRMGHVSRVWGGRANTSEMGFRFPQGVNDHNWARRGPWNCSSAERDKAPPSVLMKTRGWSLSSILSLAGVKGRRNGRS